MSEPLEPDVPQSPKSISPTDFVIAKKPPPPKPPSYWLKVLLACNPFYLVSAGLLLYGFYRVSIDPNFLRTEIAQLVFNFTSLQVYEILLVITAIFLAWRRIWYDSTLLVGLENMLALVPFILISQAALIDTRIVWAMCLAGGILAISRFSSLKRFMAKLNFPKSLLSAGLVILIVNVGLPVVYRILHEHKIGTQPTWGAAYQTNEYTWLLLLPAVCALANVLPPARSSGELLPQRRWLPMGMFALWLVGTGVHLYCLGYVYDFTLRPDLLAPAIWVLLWTARRRSPEFQFDPVWKSASLVPPLLAAFIAIRTPGNGVFLVLTMLNAMIYGGIYFRHRDSRLALHLLFISLVALIGGLPEVWVSALAPEFTRLKCIGAGASAYFLLCSTLSRNPKLGMLGALVSAITSFFVLGDHPNTIHWAAQIGFAFLLLHSLLWVDKEHEGARTIRLLISLSWIAHAFLWMHLCGNAWMACAVAALVLGMLLASRLLSGRWGPRVVPIAALLVALSGPADFAAGKLQSTPIGLLAVIGSFVLFGLGTLAAMTKHRWHKAHSQNRSELFSG